MRRPGFSVIEVIVALGMGVFVITVVGNLVSATNRLTSSSGKEVQATAYAKEWIEVMSSQMNNFFGCSCSTVGQPFSGTCVLPTCQRTSDSQTCNYRDTAGFSSCWTTQAIGLASANLKLNLGGGIWQLQDATSSPDQPTDGVTTFTRILTMTDLQRNPAVSGPIVAAGGTIDPSTKKITVTVTWPDVGGTRQVQLSTILTAWKNF